MKTRIEHLHQPMMDDIDELIQTGLNSGVIHAWSGPSFGSYKGRSSFIWRGNNYIADVPIFRELQMLRRKMDMKGLSFYNRRIL